MKCFSSSRAGPLQPEIRNYTQQPPHLDSLELQASSLPLQREHNLPVASFTLREATQAQGDWAQYELALGPLREPEEGHNTQLGLHTALLI